MEQSKSWASLFKLRYKAYF